MQLIRTLAATGALLSLAGCVTAEQSLGPDGRLSYLVSCPGALHSMSDCQAKAEQLCSPAGYSVVGEESDVHAFVASGDGGAPVNSGRRTLFVACYAPTPKDSGASANARHNEAPAPR
jgi:hypothetical protein